MDKRRETTPTPETPEIQRNLNRDMATAMEIEGQQAQQTPTHMELDRDTPLTPSPVPPPAKKKAKITGELAPMLPLKAVGQTVGQAQQTSAQTEPTETGGDGVTEEERSICIVRAAKALIQKERNLVRGKILDNFERPARDLWPYYRKLEKELFAQFIKIPLVFEILEDEKIYFSCTGCHKLKEQKWSETIMHVCNNPSRGTIRGDFWNNSHYVGGCIAILCTACKGVLENLFNPRPLGCINCRRTKFFNLNFQEVELLAEGDSESQHLFEAYMGQHHQENQLHDQINATPWEEMCRIGFKGILPQPYRMEHTMTCIRAWLEDQQLTTPFPYWGQEGMEKLQEDARFKIPKGIAYCTLGETFPKGQSTKEFRGGWSLFRRYWCESQWMYGPTQGNKNYEAALRYLYFAPQYQPDHPWRNWLIKPAYVPQGRYWHIKEKVHIIYHALNKSPERLGSYKPRFEEAQDLFVSGLAIESQILEAHLDGVRKDLKSGRKDIRVAMDLQREFYAEINRNIIMGATEKDTIQMDTGGTASSSTTATSFGVPVDPTATFWVENPPQDPDSRQTGLAQQIEHRGLTAETSAGHRGPLPKPRISGDDGSWSFKAGLTAPVETPLTRVITAPLEVQEKNKGKIPAPAGDQQRSRSVEPQKGQRTNPLDQDKRANLNRDLRVLGERLVFPGYIQAKSLSFIKRQFMRALLHGVKQPTTQRFPDLEARDEIYLLTISLHPEAWRGFKDDRFTIHLKDNAYRCRNFAWDYYRKNYRYLPFDSKEEAAHVHSVCIWAESVTDKTVIPREYRKNLEEASARIKEVYSLELPYVAEHILESEGFMFPQHLMIQHRLDTVERKPGARRPLYDQNKDTNIVPILVAGRTPSPNNFCTNAVEILRANNLGNPAVWERLSKGWM